MTRGGRVFSVAAASVALAAIGASVRVATRQAQSNRNEAAVIGDLRVLISAQAAYAAANGGFFDSRLECLARPWDCIPGYSRSAPAFLDPALASNDYVKQGYRRIFRSACVSASCQATDEGGRVRTSKTSVDAWSMAGVPSVIGETGLMGFCADFQGLICYDSTGKPPCADRSEPSVGPNCNVMC